MILHGGVVRFSCTVPVPLNALSHRNTPSYIRTDSVEENSSGSVAFNYETRPVPASQVLRWEPLLG